MSNKATGESRYWHYRTNDLSADHLEHLKSVECEWKFIGGVEVGEQAKGKHYHAVFKFYKSIRDGSACKFICGANETEANRGMSWYLDIKNKNSETLQFIKYVFKGNRENLVYGDVDILDALEQLEFDRAAKHAAKIKEKEEAAKRKAESKDKSEAQAKKDELQKLRTEHAAIGDVDWFRENDSKYMTGADFSRLLVWAQPDATHCLDKLDNYFIYGESGMGKSSSIEFLFPGCFRKIKNNEKWDNYYNLRPEHETVYFDEMDTIDEFDLCMGGFTGIKEKCDVYPFPVRQNYGNRQLMVRPKRIIITSNFTPSQIFSTPNKYGRQPPHLEMMLKTFNRRFKVMHISEWQKLNNIYFDRSIMRTKRHITEYVSESEEELPSSSEMIPIKVERKKRQPKRITI